MASQSQQSNAQVVAPAGEEAVQGEAAAGTCAQPGMHIEDALAQQGMYVGTTVGVSMRPMLRNRRDTIIVEPLHGRRLRRFEVPLYRRGDAYVLHRCVEVHPSGYTMLGDNCLNKEPGISDERVIGVLTGFYRGNKQVNMGGFPYRAYVRVWYALYPLRRCAMHARVLAGRVKRRVVGGEKQVVPCATAGEPGGAAARGVRESASAARAHADADAASGREASGNGRPQ